MTKKSQLELIREKIREQQERKAGTSNFSDKSIYRHYHIALGEELIVRFVSNPETDLDVFWRERQMINLVFPGIKGNSDGRKVTVQVPCVDMWKDSDESYSARCPVLSEVTQWFNVAKETSDKELEKKARGYWRKKSYIFQGFICNVPKFLSEQDPDEAPDNPIRRFNISPKIFTPITEGLMDTDYDSLPTDLESGRDFKIKKAKMLIDGTWPDYSASGWKPMPRALTDDELNAIEEFGYWNLDEFLPKRPTEQQFTAIKELFEASVEEELYDPERWANYYKPFGYNNNNDSGDDKTTTSTKKKQIDVLRKKLAEKKQDTNDSVEETADEKEENAPKKKLTPQEIFAKIESRRKAEAVAE